MKHGQFPLSYLLAFCGYVLILLIEKILFSNISFTIEEVETPVELKEVEEIKISVENRNIPPPMIEKTRHERNLSTGNVNKAFRFFTLKSDAKLLLNLNEVKPKKMAHSKKSSQKLFNKNELEEIENKKTKILDKKEKEFKKIFSNLTQISSLAKERCITIF